MAKAWRLAKSLEMLRAQINALSPNRSKISDGTKGDDAHAARKSDHNPNAAGVVQAIDLTDDEKHGVDNVALANALLGSRDPRIKYVIADGKKASGAGGPSPWKWRPYTGANSHHHHLHISVVDKASLYDDASAWDLSGFTVHKADEIRPVIPETEHPVLSKGAKGEAVERLQKLLNKRGANLVPDGDFGERTDKAVRAFQKASRLVSDGIAGVYTWSALERP